MNYSEYSRSKRRFLKRSALSTLGIYFGLHNKALGINPIFNSNYSDILKYSKEASYYVQTPRGVKCMLCPNECTLKEGEAGNCNNRENIGGKVYSIGYGNPCAIHIDPVEKKPLFHFLPSSKTFSIAVAGCNLACLNCQNWSISQTSPRGSMTM